MKKCIRCGENKGISEFHKHKAMKDGHLNKCRVCVKQCVSEWRKNNPDCRKKENARKREKVGWMERSEWVKYQSANAIGRKASSLKYSHKRRVAKSMYKMSELDEFVLEEAAILCRDREESTGVKWHIDHIVPFFHKDACGLNSYANIQVVPAKWNVRKSNTNMEVFSYTRDL